MEEDLQEAKVILIDIEQELKDGNITQEEYKSIQESMQDIIDEVTVRKPEQEKMLQHCEEFISLYEEKPIILWLFTFYILATLHSINLFLIHTFHLFF